MKRYASKEREGDEVSVGVRGRCRSCEERGKEREQSRTLAADEATCRRTAATVAVSLSAIGRLNLNRSLFG